MTDNKDKKDQIKPFTLFNNETGQSFEIPIISGNDGGYECYDSPTVIQNANSRCR